MKWIQDGEMAATVIYPPTQAADGIRLARLIAQNRGLSDLVQVEVPKRIVLNAPVVTKDSRQVPGAGLPVLTPQKLRDRDGQSRHDRASSCSA